MAIVTFGSAARAKDSIALKNTTNTTLVFALMHGPGIGPHTTKYLTLMDFDSRLRGGNLRNNTLYAVGSDGHSPYLDDVAEFAKLITSGQITVYTASTVASGGFTLGTVLASSGYGDGSVIFS